MDLNKHVRTPFWHMGCIEEDRGCRLNVHDVSTYQGRPGTPPVRCP
jgi:hypothetical protein